MKNCASKFAANELSFLNTEIIIKQAQAQFTWPQSPGKTQHLQTP